VITHVFNSSVVSGPETLAIPALRRLGEPVSIVFLTETRLGAKSDGPPAYARELGHEVHTVPVRGRWDRAAFAALRETLDRVRPRVVHAHDVKASLYSLKAARSKPSFGARLFSTHHGAVARKGKIRLYEEYYVRFILPKFDGVMVVCEWDRASLLRRGLPERLLHMHPNGVDRPRVDPTDRARRAREIRERWRASYTGASGLPGPDEAVFLGAVARLSWEKRHDRMLNALATVRRENPGLRFAFVAFGTAARPEEEQALREQTRRLELEDSVFWMGYSKTIGQEMAGFDLLLCLSDGEGMPINLIEAGWSATPVFSTRVGGIPDLVTPETGYLVEKSASDAEIGRALARALGDAAGRTRVGEAYQRRVEAGFSEQAWLDVLRTAYK
jgi:glycosyltransferase involved in cell wall biosynthesis